VGRNVGGLNSSNREVYKEWSKIINKRQKKVKKQIKKLCKVAGWQIGIREDFEVEFTSLYAEDETEKATRENLQASTDITYLQAGIITPEEVREEIKQRGLYDNLQDGMDIENYLRELDNSAGANPDGDKATNNNTN
jgi:hypothetical protein